MASFSILFLSHISRYNVVSNQEEVISIIKSIVKRAILKYMYLSLSSLLNMSFVLFRSPHVYVVSVKALAWWCEEKLKFQRTARSRQSIAILVASKSAAIRVNTFPTRSTRRASTVEHTEPKFHAVIKLARAAR